jgi:hypothetical protein
MNANAIRDMEISAEHSDIAQAVFLREIAAQLAELNARLKSWSSNDGRHALDVRKITLET